MLQDVLTYIIVAAAVVTALISIIKNILPAKSHSGYITCSECKGCEVKDQFSG